MRVLESCHKVNNVRNAHSEEEVTRGASRGVLKTLKAGTRIRNYTNVIYNKRLT